MRIIQTHSFIEDYDSLPDVIRERASEKLAFFAENTRHPSLKTHIIRGTGNPKVFEGYVTNSYRFTFNYGEDCIFLRRIGPHSIIDEEARG